MHLDNEGNLSFPTRLTLATQVFKGVRLLKEIFDRKSFRKCLFHHDKKTYKLIQSHNYEYFPSRIS